MSTNSQSLPADSLFRSNSQISSLSDESKSGFANPIPTSTIASTLTGQSSTATVTGPTSSASNITLPATVNTTFSPTAASNVPVTPGIDNTTGVFPTMPPKKNLSIVPPNFFVGPREKENSIVFESQLSNESGSFHYGDRRLSSILAENNLEEKKEDKEAEVPVRRIAVTSADASRGIFGDKRLKALSSNTIVAAAIAVDNTNNTTEETTNTSANTLQPSNTIRVFGYPSNLIHNVIQHFASYGKIEEYKQTPGRWMTITYESSASALAALKGNGMIISKNHMIGVLLEPEEPTPDITSEIIPIDESKGVFTNLKGGLGSGKVGISAADKRNARTKEESERLANNSIISRWKEYLFAW